MMFLLFVVVVVGITISHFIPLYIKNLPVPLAYFWYSVQNLSHFICLISFVIMHFWDEFLFALTMLFSTFKTRRQTKIYK